MQNVKTWFQKNEKHATGCMIKNYTHAHEE